MFKLKAFGEFLESKGGQLAVVVTCFFVSLGSCIFVMVAYGASAPVAIGIMGVLTTFVGAITTLTSSRSTAAGSTTTTNTKE